MNVWGSVKKFSLVGAMVVVGSVSFTGCLTDDKKDDPAPTDNSVALTAEKKDTVWNVQGPYLGAYNLVDGAGVASNAAAAGKDLVDLAVVAGGAVVWPKTLGSLNGSTFVTAASGFDYAAATDSTLIKGFTAGTAATATKVLAANDVILAKIHGGKYAAIKIYAVTETASDNKDYIYFGYRLTP